MASQVSLLSLPHKESWLLYSIGCLQGFSSAASFGCSAPAALLYSQSLSILTKSALTIGGIILGSSTFEWKNRFDKRAIHEITTKNPPSTDNANSTDTNFATPQQTTFHGQNPSTSPHSTISSQYRTRVNKGFRHGFSAGLITFSALNFLAFRANNLSLTLLAAPCLISCFVTAFSYQMLYTHFYN